MLTVCATQDTKVDCSTNIVSQVRGLNAIKRNAWLQLW